MSGGRQPYGATVQAPGISHAAVDSPESMRAPMMWHI